METPPSLDVSPLGDRLRGQLRPAVDAVMFRRMWLLTLSGVLLLTLGMVVEHPVAMTVAFLLGFLLLVAMASSIWRLVGLPQTWELDGRRFEVADEEHPLAAILRVEATDGPPKLVILLRDGTRRVVPANADHHDLADLAWLADEVNRRLEAA